MEIQNGDANHVSEKRFSNVLRRKGVISKRKKAEESSVPSTQRENLWKRGKIYGRTLMNLVSHHPRGSSHGGFGLQEYEFSCSNSPVNPVPFHMAKRKHHHFPTHILRFPCIRPSPVEDEDDKEDQKEDGQLDHNDLPSLIQKLSPLLSPLCPTISSSPCELQVDRQAEKFIAKFYEQLTLENRKSFLQYQEMLERGAR